MFPSAEAVGHHAPDETCEFSCNSGDRDIVLGVAEQPVEFSAETFVFLVGIGNYLWRIAFLTRCECFGFVSGFASGIAVRRCDQKSSQMGIAGLGDAKMLSVFCTGMIPGNQPQIGSKAFGALKKIEITNL